MKDEATSNVETITIDEETYYLKECVSKNGNKYQVGYLNEEDALKDASHSYGNLESKSTFFQEVDWPVENPQTWVTITSEEIETTEITRYSLSDNYRMSYYDYRLLFTNLKHYDYYFVDEDGDIYECNTYRNGNHYIRYNSNKPTIKMVKGS